MGFGIYFDDPDKLQNRNEARMIGGLQILVAFFYLKAYGSFFYKEEKDFYFFYLFSIVLTCLTLGLT